MATVRFNSKVRRPETETRSLVNSMNQACICAKFNCIKDCVCLETVPECREVDIGLICNLLDEFIAINDAKQVSLKHIHFPIYLTMTF